MGRQCGEPWFRGTWARGGCPAPLSPGDHEAVEASGFPGGAGPSQALSTNAKGGASARQAYVRVREDDEDHDGGGDGFFTSRETEACCVLQLLYAKEKMEEGRERSSFVCGCFSVASMSINYQHEKSDRLLGSWACLVLYMDGLLTYHRLALYYIMAQDQRQAQGPLRPLGQDAGCVCRGIRCWRS